MCSFSYGSRYRHPAVERGSGMRRILIHTADLAGDFLYGDICPLCGRVPGGASGGRICPECAVRLPVIRESYCLKCGKPLTDEQQEYCTECQKNPHVFEQHRAALSYQGNVRLSLYQFKYANRRSFARFYAELLTVELGDWIRVRRITCLVPVPLHEKRRKKRGYNQAELIADRLGMHLDIPVDRNLLVRRKATQPMKELTAVERRQNLEQAFSIGRMRMRRSGILLVDDIFTTGATMDAAAAVLTAAGNERVYAVSVAIGG